MSERVDYAALLILSGGFLVLQMCIQGDYSGCILTEVQASYFRFSWVLDSEFGHILVMPIEKLNLFIGLLLDFRAWHLVSSSIQASWQPLDSFQLQTAMWLCMVMA